MRSYHFFTACILLMICCLAEAAEPAIQIAVEKRGDAFILDATINFPAPNRTAWEVLTDFDNMVSILSNLTTSKVTSRIENTLLVQQEGIARFGILSYAFSSEREIRLDPMKRIQARQLSGNAKHYFSELDLTPAGESTLARYHAEVTPESGLALIFGGSFIEHEVEEQFTAMAAEMSRRKATAP
jgi:carbon monoxide dehydrogenase subunit G